MDGDNSQVENDEFWQVAMCHRDTARAIEFDSEGDSDDSHPSATFSMTYVVPWRKTQRDDARSNITLQLSPLRDHEGIWSPLGAQAWHASSLLVAYLSQSTILDDGYHPRTLLSKHLDSWSPDPANVAAFVALELGSGAVGLVGLVLGLVLGDCLSRGKFEDKSNTPVPCVMLTDNEPSVLKNLQENVTRTLEGWRRSSEEFGGRRLPECHVEHLHWDDKLPEILEAQSLQLVVGSELVYTQDTAQACAKVVLAILDQHPDALVFILQVTDRDGWTNVFLPTLQEKDNVQMISEVEAIQDSDLHQLAATMIPPGGTLDRFAYSGVYVWNKSGRVAAALLECNERAR
jgi:Lysine methyltransferase